MSRCRHTISERQFMPVPWQHCNKGIRAAAHRVPVITDFDITVLVDVITKPSRRCSRDHNVIDECLIAILVVAFDHEMLVPYRYFAAVDVRRAGFDFDREDVFDVVPVLCVMHD